MLINFVAQVSNLESAPASPILLDNPVIWENKSLGRIPYASAKKRVHSLTTCFRHVRLIRILRTKANMVYWAYDGKIGWNYDPPSITDKPMEGTKQP